MSSGESQQTHISFLNALELRVGLEDHIETYSARSTLTEDIINRGLTSANETIAELAADEYIRAYFEKLGDEVVRASGIIIELEPSLLMLGLRQEVAAKKTQIKSIIDSPLWKGVKYFMGDTAKCFLTEVSLEPEVLRQQTDEAFVDGTTGDEDTTAEFNADKEIKKNNHSDNSQTNTKKVPKASVLTKNTRHTSATVPKGLIGEIPADEQILSSSRPLTIEQEAKNPHEEWARDLQESVTEGMAYLRSEGLLKRAKNHADSLGGRRVKFLIINGESVEVQKKCKELQEAGLLLGRKIDPTIRDYIVMSQIDNFTGQFKNSDKRIRNAALAVVEDQIKRDFEEAKIRERRANLVGTRP
jgi:hypothetical protein